MLLYAQYIFPTQTLHLNPDMGYQRITALYHPAAFSYSFTATKVSASDLHKMKPGYILQPKKPQKLCN